jgi:uncharacterized protein Yka (UPF0111/DUF47 family)
MDNRTTVTSKFGVQKIGKGKSPVLPKEKDPTINLRDRLNDILSGEKHTLDGYQSGLNEIIDEQFFNLVKKNIENCRLLQRKMFEQLFDLGEYQADTATPPQIEDALDMFNNYKVQLPYSQNEVTKH